MTAVLTVTDSEDGEAVSAPEHRERLLSKLHRNFDEFKREYKPLRKTVRQIKHAFDEP